MWRTASPNLSIAFSSPASSVSVMDALGESVARLLAADGLAQWESLTS